MIRICRAFSFELDLADRTRSEIEAIASGRRAAFNFAVATDRDIYGADLPPADWSELEPDWIEPDWNERRSVSKFELNYLWPMVWPSSGLSAARAAGQTGQLAFADYIDARAASIKKLIKHEKASIPGFKSRYDPHQSYIDRNPRLDPAGRDTFTLTNLGQPVRIKGSTRRLRWFLDQRHGTIRLAHLVRSGHHVPWRIVVIVELDAPEAELRDSDVRIGLDLGLTHFAILSTGEKIENPRVLGHELKRLRRAQKSAARSEQDRLEAEATARAAGTLGARERLPKSKRHQAKDAVVARIHARVAAIRSEFHHSLAKRLVEKYPVIGVEDLAVANMIRNHCLSRAIADAGWSSFLQILRYKAQECGTLVVTAGRWSPSSQKCSACGVKNPALKDLSIRRWVCPNCGIIHDRDINAGINLVPTADQITKARTEVEMARVETAKKREQQKARVKKASETKQIRKAERLAREGADRAAGREIAHSARLSRHTTKSNPWP